ncbi:mannose-6-phosphate isomerase-like protein (cupin superfamily) [Streptacidiphilus sp. MAP12-20]
MSRPDQGGASSYRAVLALPHARGLFVAGALARLPYGLLSLPLLLALRQAVGSYAGAGTAFGAFGLVSAVLGPYRARLVERRPVALIWLSGGFAATLAAIALLAAQTRLPEGAALALAVAAGALPPPVGPLLRARWSAMSGGEAQRQAALSLDTVAESTVFATGPVLAGALLAVGSPPLALAACAATVVVGFAALASLLARIPARVQARAWTGRRDSSTPQPGPDCGPRAGVPFRSGAFVSLLAVVLAVGWAVAMAELAVVAAWGAAVSGPLLAFFSVGGVLGGLLYGRRSWRWSPRRRLAALGAAGALCHALPALLFAPAGAAVALLCAGAATDAALITAYLLVEELVPEGARTEGSAWVNTCFNLGVALGSSVAGLLLGTAVGARGVLVAGAAGAALPALGLVSVRLLKFGGQRQGPAETGLMTTHQAQPAPVDLAAALASFDDLWSPRIVAAVNDYDVRIAKVQGEYVWHSHADTDEFFLVLDGELTIGLREPDAAERSVTLTRGSVFVVPRGVEHRPESATGASILMFEPTGTLSSGSYDGEIPDHIDSTTGHALTSG